VKRPYVAPQVESRPREKCLVEGCSRLEELASGRSAGGLCAAHRKRKQQGRPLEPPLHDGVGRLLTPRQALVAAGLGLGDIDSTDDQEFDRAVERLAYAALQYVRRRRVLVRK